MYEFNKLTELEEYFKSVNCYGKYNNCFTCQTDWSILPSMFGLMGLVIVSIADKNNKGISGYLVNQFDRGICLIPVIYDTLYHENKIDIDNYIFIPTYDIKKISVKNEDFVYKRIKIILNNKTKYSIKTINKTKNADFHEINLNKFIKECAVKFSE